jgi:FtsP/CotA-like multicopper oxidase with cupredoxin domain
VSPNDDSESEPKEFAMTKRDKPYFSAGPRMSRRSLLRGAPLGAASLLAMRSAGPAWAQAQAQAPAAADHSIRIALTSLEIARGKIIQTTAYNGTVPGPVLRLKEGRPVKIEVKNDSGYANLIHWHGLMIPSAQDGATEEGSPIIDPGKSLIYSYDPKPSGTRWYHSHAMAMTDLSKSTYSGEFGFLIVEPAAGDPGSYDREVLLAAHHWDGHWVSLQDIKKGPPPNNGLEVMYHAATLGDRMLGHGEPIRVREGERVLFRVLNASGNMGISLALPGHRFQVLALDGNPVPTRAAVDTLKLDVAERADVIVEMSNPGIWVFGSNRRRRPQYGDGSSHRVRQPERRAHMGGSGKQDVELHRIRQDCRYGGRSGRDHPSQVRKGPRRKGRLQSLDHQRKIVARYEPAVHGDGRKALSARHEQQQRGRAPRPYAPAFVRDHQSRRQADIWRHQGHHKSTSVFHR